MRIGIIGGGFMGEAFLRGLVRGNVATPNDIAVAEVSPARRTALGEHGVRVTDDAQSAAIGAEVVLIAVKPQDLAAAGTSLQGVIGKDAVVISIAAGVRLDDIRRFTGHRACVRVMPNLPAAIGEGAAVYLVAPEVSAAQRARVREVVAAVAKVAVEVPDDEAVDLATAIHGSGPAYVYLFIESLVEVAVRLGMKRHDAEQLVLATVAGSAAYALETGLHPAVLRNAVTSPGGTTAAALAELEAAGFRTAIDSAVDAAFERAQELGE
ncbi:MAG: pyrroline-5-carboxylate reductase [Chloroflexi bacterium]|nr:MAG: pyrroline-5-carboxylate reductase [Chloroflexota bacterium]